MMNGLRSLAVVVGALSVAGCISTGGVSRPAPVTAVQAVAVVVHDFMSPGMAVAGASVTCNGTDRGLTNADGFLETTAQTGEHFECTFAKDGYRDTVAAFRPRPPADGCADCQFLRASLTALAPPPSAQPITTNATVGRLRVANGTVLVDDSGAVLPTYAHAGDLFSLFTRDRARATSELDAIAGAGYRGVRVWTVLGGAYWAGRDINPDTTPDYWEHMRAFRDAVVSRGLRLVLSQGDIGRLRDRQAFMRRVASLDAEVSFVDWIDCGNEAWQTGEPDPRRLAECVNFYAAAGGRALKTLTDAPLYFPGGPPAHEQMNAYSIPPADAIDTHSFRGGRSWDKRRHIWGYTYCGHGCPDLKVGIGSEGPGPGRRVSAIENQHELDDEAMGLLAVASHLGRQAYVWFSGEGVIIDRGLATEPGFTSVPRIVSLLPRDLYTYQHQTHSEPKEAGHRRVVTAQAEHDVRVDGRIHDDGRFAFTIDGPSGAYDLEVMRAFEGELIHPGTGERTPVAHRVGERLRVEFTRGRVFVGRVR